MDSDCLFWNNRITIPQKYENNILKSLHTIHLGINAIKGIARSYFWCPKIDHFCQIVTHATLIFLI